MEGKSKGLRKKKKETHREEGERDCGQTKDCKGEGERKLPARHQTLFLEV